MNKGVQGDYYSNGIIIWDIEIRQIKKIFESISVGHNENSSFVLSLCVILHHYCDVIMGAMASEITSLTIVYSTVYSGKDQRKHQSSVSLAFGRGIHWEPVNSPHKWPLTRRMSPFDDAIMILSPYGCSVIYIYYYAINLGKMYFISFLWQRDRLHHMDDVHKEFDFIHYRIIWKHPWFLATKLSH